MSYKVERDWIYKELRCVVILGDFGHRCGYVGVPESHPLYGKHYSEHVPVLNQLLITRCTSETPEKEEHLNYLAIVCWDGQKASMDIALRIHGGVTYASGDPDYPVESDGLWWIGYDCGHAGDAKDLSAIESPAVRGYYENTNYGTLRTLEYCIEECERLADQLRSIGR